MRSVILASGGFLLGILWMDLLFDVQLFRDGSAAVATIAPYYRHATIEAYPMNRLIAAMMLVTAIGALIQLVRSRDRRRDLILFVLAAIPVALALSSVVPNAMRLGRGVDPAAEQARLAWTICVAHLICFASMAAFVIGEARRTPN